MILFLFVLQFFATILCHELGHNKLFLIEEGKSVEVQCLSHKEMPNNAIRTEWFNVTLESIHSNKHKSNKVLLKSNPLIDIQIDGSIRIKNAKQEISGYYTCEVQYYQKSTQTNGQYKDSKYRLYLIEIVKKPSITALKADICVGLLAKSDSFVQKSVYILITNLLSKEKHEFQTEVNFNETNIRCESQSDVSITKCMVEMEFKSKNHCNKTLCHLSKEDFAKTLKKELNKLQNLLKSAQNTLKESVELFEINVHKINVTVKYLEDCAEGHYLDANQCRPCHSGRYKPIGSDKCMTCAVNTYNPYFGQSSCIECPTNTFTIYDFEGAAHEKDCIHQGFLGFWKDNIWNIFSIFE